MQLCKSPIEVQKSLTYLLLPHQAEDPVTCLHQPPASNQPPPSSPKHQPTSIQLYLPPNHRDILATSNLPTPLSTITVLYIPPLSHLPTLSYSFPLLSTLPRSNTLRWRKMKLTFRDLKQQKFVIEAEPSETENIMRRTIDFPVHDSS
ncbi:hypothetical protein I7I51_06715 [Histoplasma capsulatum]|uniref:Uncharacterized protein n=1 Tax=Ajellomyces capsulatus TaxID=5037 RepID=A0A8A1MME9_AJECA|nr:hypothetical protein I7I51_06715 [Histoplasma capsulatum]